MTTLIDPVTAMQTLDHISASLRVGLGGWVMTPNLDFIRRLSADHAFAALCEHTTLRVADGMPLLWAGRLQRTPLPQRVPGSDLVHSLTERAAREGYSIFFLGGNPGVADRAAAKLRERHPTLRIAGTECPPLGFENDQDYLSGLRTKLSAAAPDIVYVALGSPKQELLTHTLVPLLPRAWFLGIGISLSFVTGEVRRAPIWLQRIGLEWAHRMSQEPGRLAKRYLLEGLPFAARLLSVSAWRGVTGSEVARMRALPHEHQGLRA